MAETSNLFVLSILSYTIFFVLITVNGRQYHVKVIPSKDLVRDAFHSNVAERLVECVYKCTVAHGCSSVTFNKTSKRCGLYSTEHTAAEVQGSDTLYAQTDQRSSPPPSPRLVLLKGKTWRKASRQCMMIKGKLFSINTKEKQEEAVKLAKRSGLDLIAVGIFKKNIYWHYMDESRVGYAAWAPDEPYTFGIFVAISKKDGFKWAAITSRVNGGICLDLIAVGIFRKNMYWHYTDESRVGYAAWAPDEPYTFGIYVAISKKDGYKWASITSRVNGGICELDV